MPVAEPIIRRTAKYVTDFMRGLMHTEVAEQGVRTAEGFLKRAWERGAGKGLGEAIRVRGLGSEYAGTEAAREYVRATRATPRIDSEDLGRGTRNLFLKAVRDNPEMPPDVRQMMFDTNVRHATAQHEASYVVQEAFDPILRSTKDPVALKQKVQDLSDYMTLANQLSTLKQQIAAGIERPLGLGGMDIRQIGRELRMVAQKVKDQPDVVETHARLRRLYDRLFQDLVDRGYVSPNRYRGDYLPIRQLDEVVQSLGKLRGRTKAGGEILPSMLKREGGGGVVETDIVKLTHDTLTDFYRKVAEDDLVENILRDETLNFTRFFKPGDSLRRMKGVGVYRPGPGSPGFGNREVTSTFAQGVSDVLGEAAEREGLYLGGHVLPASVVRKLNNFHPQQPDELTSGFYNLGKAWGLTMTAYNIKNTALNFGSDLPLALLGLPGEKSRALGILRFFPQSFKAAVRGVQGKPNQLVLRMADGEHVVDPFELAKSAGITQSTLLSDVGGVPIDQNLAKLSEAVTPNGLERISDFFVRTRQVVETAPRIAAGLEALARTGSMEEFGRVGRLSTLPYGIGAPDLTRNPFVRFLTPFIQFLGLATARVFDLATTKGSQARTLTALAAVPTGIWLWNRHSEEFRKVDDAVAKFERGRSYVIVPDPRDPAKPWMLPNGDPFVMRFRYWVPEEIMSSYGLGNLASRAHRVQRGLTTVPELMGESGQQVGEQMTGQIGPIGSLMQLGYGRTWTGRELTPQERFFGNLTPQTRLLQETYDQIRAPEDERNMVDVLDKLVGPGRAIVQRSGRRLLNSDLIDANRKVAKIRGQIISARRNRDTVKANDLTLQLRKEVERAKRIREAIKRER